MLMYRVTALGWVQGLTREDTCHTREGFQRTLYKAWDWITMATTMMWRQADQ